MKLLKLFVSFIILSLVSAPAFAVGEISIDKDNGVYHIILKGEKSRKRLNL